MRITVESNSAAKTVGLSSRRPLLGLILWLVVCFSAAAVGRFFGPGEWYAGLRKPTWTPPAWVFAPVWTVLYVLMASAAWLVWLQGGFKKQRAAMTAFLLQLFCNGLWSPLFFGLQSPGLAFLDIVLLFGLLLLTGQLFWRTRRIAGVLLVPYLGWITFAMLLNYSIWRLNR